MYYNNIIVSSIITIVDTWIILKQKLKLIYCMLIKNSNSYYSASY